MSVSSEFLNKYNVSGPRYTSYPPANFFNNAFSVSDYIDELKASNSQTPKDISIYIHIPFCQKKCNYCSFTSFPMGGLEDFGLRIADYLAALEKEIDFYKEQLGDQEIKSIYFG